MTLMAISRLNVALEKLINAGKDGNRVFARERSSGGAQAREYLIMTPEDAWRETIRQKHSHLYEVLSSPCNMYLDIEWKCKSPPRDEKNTLKQIVMLAVEKLKEVYGIDDISVHTASASGWVGDAYKCSWHVHLVSTSTCWSNAACAGDFVRRHLSDVSEVDKVPYHAPKQNWRCIGSSKASDPSRVFMPITKQKFMDCLVGCDVKGRNVIGPALARKRSVAPCAPDYVIALCNLLGDMRTDNMIQMGDRYWCVPYRQRIHCAIANRTHSSNHQYAIIDLWGMRWRQKCHNEACMQKESPWCAFEDIELAHRIWTRHVRPMHQKMPCAPARRVERPPNNACVTYHPRLRGPPAHVPAHTVMKCMDGYYMASQ